MKWFRFLYNIGFVFLMLGILTSLFGSDEVADAFTGFGSLLGLIGIIGSFVGYLLHGLNKKKPKDKGQ